MDDFGVSRAVEYRIRASAQNFSHPDRHVFPPNMNGVGGTKLPGFGQFVVVQIDGNHRAGSGQMRAEHGPQTDSPHADDYGGFPDL